MIGFLVGWGVFWLLVWSATWIAGSVGKNSEVEGAGILFTFISLAYLIAVGAGYLAILAAG